MLLAGGVGVDQFVSAAKQAYVKAAVTDVLPLGSRLNISRVSVVTGLTRKEVSRLLEAVRGGTLSVRRTKEQRAMRVLRGWCIDPRFCSRSGQPAQLSLRGGKRKAFALLVKLYGGDVTPMSVLRELERLNVISTTKEGLVRVRSAARRLPSHLPQQMLEIANLFTDFARAITPARSNESSPAFFGYRECDSVSPDDTALFGRTFSRRAAALLEGFDQWRASRHNLRNASTNTGRVGVGVYLINEKAQSRPLISDRGLRVRQPRRSQ